MARPLGVLPAFFDDSPRLAAALRLQSPRAEAITMKIRFWGVRGSIPSPGPLTAKVGGNTSCVEVSCGSTRLILDAGTGIRGLGESLMGQGSLDLHLFLSHYHWDHIQGLPFFVPAYCPANHIQVYGGSNGLMSVEQALRYQMSAPVFPVRLDELGARVSGKELRPGQLLEVGEASVQVMRLNHPGGSLGYRIEHAGRVMVYATDCEPYACVDPSLVRFAKGADVLIYDSQYTVDEYEGRTGPSRVGWGHSTDKAAVQLAIASDVGKLVLFHHDPSRTDVHIDHIEERAVLAFHQTVAAREGMFIDFGLSAKAA